MIHSIEYDKTKWKIVPDILFAYKCKIWAKISFDISMSRIFVRIGGNRQHITSYGSLYSDLIYCENIDNQTRKPLNSLNSNLSNSTGLLYSS